ncbi:MAG: competence/damage-inducible protein A, partial [Clostridia bacterium]|nr:competence/damage-inducible protein A [Clostridia bacterium]
ITTGGLGPTMDDLTKETIAEAMGRKLVLDQESYDKIKVFFERLNRKMADNNAKQAYLPEGSTVIPNNNGTAPGCIIENGGKTVIMFPGPPKEMIPMFEDTVYPYFEKRTGQIIASKMVKVFGIGESEMEMRIIDLIQKQTNPTIAPYVGVGEVILRVTAGCKNKEEAEVLINPVIESIKERLGAHVYSTEGENMEEVLVKLLAQRSLKISVAESCTGGMLASRLVNVSGVSSVLDRGYVTYTNEAKIEELGVTAETLKSFGAVSRQTAEEMVLGLVRKTHTQAGLAITGIAGPEGGTPEKPVGLVYIAAILNGRLESRELKLIGDRERVRTMSCLNAMDLLRQMLLEL